MHGRRRRYLYVISAILVASFGLFVLTSWIMARSFVAPHHEAVGSAPTGSPFEIKRVAFTTVDGLKLFGWYFPATGKRGVVATIERRFNSFLGLPLHPLGDLLVWFGQEQLGVAIDSINPLRAITSLHVPLLIISGEEDTRVLVEDTRQLYRAANAPKELWLVPKAGHDDLFHYARTEYEKRVVGFTEKYINKSPPQSPP
jgi:pimeloyl-ACP methyl ester carboxylesterase